MSSKVWAAAVLVAALTFPPWAQAFEQGDELFVVAFCKSKEAAEKLITSDSETRQKLWEHYLDTSECYKLIQPWPFVVVEVGTSYKYAEGVNLVLLTIAPFRLDTGAFSTELFYGLFQENLKGA